MGYFSEKDVINKENYRDREDVKDNLIEKMIKIIMQAFPEKNYFELVELEEASLRGLYGQAKRRLNANIAVDEDNYNLEEYEDYKRS